MSNTETDDAKRKATEEQAKADAAKAAEAEKAKKAAEMKAAEEERARKLEEAQQDAAQALETVKEKANAQTLLNDLASAVNSPNVPGPFRTVFNMIHGFLQSPLGRSIALAVGTFSGFFIVKDSLKAVFDGKMTMGELLKTATTSALPAAFLVSLGLQTDPNAPQPPVSDLARQRPPYYQRDNHRTPYIYAAAPGERLPNQDATSTQAFNAAEAYRKYRQDPNAPILIPVPPGQGILDQKATAAQAFNVAAPNGTGTSAAPAPAPTAGGPIYRSVGDQPLSAKFTLANTPTAAGQSMTPSPAPAPAPQGPQDHYQYGYGNA